MAGTSNVENLEDWKALAGAIYIASAAAPDLRDVDRKDWNSKRASYATIFHGANRHLVKAGASHWSAAASTIVNRHLMDARLDMRLWGGINVLRERCFRVGLLAVEGRLDEIPPAERAVAAKVLTAPDPAGIFKKCSPLLKSPEARANLATRLLSAPNRRVPSAAGNSLEFAYPWRQKGQYGRGALRMTASRAAAPVVALEGPVPAEYVLASPGNSVPVIDLGGALFRPVMAPGEWRAISPDEAQRAALGGDLWRDSPFFRRPANDKDCAPLSAYASEPIPYRPGDSEAEAEGAEECRRRAGTLLELDGALYKRTQEPYLSIAAVETLDSRMRRTDAQEPMVVYRVAWRLGDDLAMTDIQDSTIVRCSRRIVHWDALPGTIQKSYKPERELADQPVPTALRFGIAESDRAAETLREIVRFSAGIAEALGLTNFYAVRADFGAAPVLAFPGEAAPASAQARNALSSARSLLGDGDRRLAGLDLAAAALDADDPDLLDAASRALAVLASGIAPAKMARPEDESLARLLGDEAGAASPVLSPGNAAREALLGAHATVAARRLATVAATLRDGDDLGAIFGGP